MDSLYFVVMLAGVTGLAVWSVLPKPRSGGGWWPFDTREDGGADNGTGPSGRAAGARGRSGTGR